MIRITGLINCVGVILRIYGEGALEYDYVSIVGGHFVTPQMYNFDPPAAFTAEGNQFIADIQALIVGIPTNKIEASFFVKAAAGQGSNRALQEARQAAAALRATLGFGGQIEEISGDVIEEI